MKILGCDLHAKQQSIAMVDTETGEFPEKTLSHEGNEVREFYAALEGPVVVGIEVRSVSRFASRCQAFRLSPTLNVRERSEGDFEPFSCTCNVNR